MIEYAVQYIATTSFDYQSVWWRLFHPSNFAEWSNVFFLAKLLLSLPASNGKLEQHTSLTNQSLDNLLLLLSKKISLQDFNPDQSIDLWWSARRKKAVQISGSDQTSTPAQADSHTELEDMFHCWDELMNSDKDTDRPRH